MVTLKIRHSHQNIKDGWTLTGKDNMKTLYSPSALDKLLAQWVFTQPGYPQLRTCKNNSVFLFFYVTFFTVITRFLTD